MKFTSQNAPPNFVKNFTKLLPKATSTPHFTRGHLLSGELELQNAMLLVPLFASSFYAPIAILARGRSPAVQASASAIEAPTTTGGAAAADPIQVWDGVFGEEALQTLLKAGEQRGHGFTAVFDRGEDATLRGRTIIECSLTALLDEIGDRSRFVEYWWRAEHISMRAHRCDAPHR